MGNPNGQSPTPWIKMLLAKINSKNGFPVLVLPRGHRLKKLPESFCNKNFRKMKICSWNTNESQAWFRNGHPGSFEVENGPFLKPK